MSETVDAFGALFAIGMLALGLALFVKGTKEKAEIENPLPGWARPRGWR